MRYLLDTRIVIWSLEDHVNLKFPARLILENADNTIFVSAISLMEMSIKLKLGKIPEFIISLEDITKQSRKDGFELLPIEAKHIFAYQSIPFYDDHRDPFDRFLLATALSEQIPIISYDEKFLGYRPFIEVID
jgi:PIN domain nuclease of toxin-antitoxin system